MSQTETVEHFRVHGWMRITDAFDARAAAAMREVVWRALARLGVRRENPSTWTNERPTHLKHIRDDPAFSAVGGARVCSAIGALLAVQPHDPPKNWGSPFVAFPSQEGWTLPTHGWHVDANYASQLWPPRGVKSFALFGDVTPRGGGTLILSGSHRLIHKWFVDHPPPPDACSADMRRLLQAHPYLRALQTEGEPKQRIARFMNRVEDVAGVPLRVIEHTGSAGEVLLLHPLLMHVASINQSAAPRFLLSGGVTTDQWGWGASALRDAPLSVT
ncbi:MAG: phytanoyl-CoA dioxygenase family protein [Proteobacteria bacterium]|nr:phytanoyl-CoA dioxygenase family protein [Pseudomonadota bacterium]